MTFDAPPWPETAILGSANTKVTITPRTFAASATGESASATDGTPLTNVPVVLSGTSGTEALEGNQIVLRDSLECQVHYSHGLKAQDLVTVTASDGSAVKYEVEGDPVQVGAIPGVVTATLTRAK